MFAGLSEISIFVSNIEECDRSNCKKVLSLKQLTVKISKFIFKQECLSALCRACLSDTKLYSVLISNITLTNSNTKSY